MPETIVNEADNWGTDWVERYENLTRHVDEQMDDINRLMAERNEAIERLRDLLAVYDKDVALLRANGFLAPGQRRAAGQRAAAYLQQFDGSEGA